MLAADRKPRAARNTLPELLRWVLLAGSLLWGVCLSIWFWGFGIGLTGFCNGFNQFLLVRAAASRAP